MIIEVWKSVVGWEEAYSVSNLGRVMSLRNENIMKQGTNVKSGYLYVQLYRMGKYKTLSVHRLVANAFLPKEDGRSQVNHKNLIKTDNRVENLEWCSPKENTRHYIRNAYLSGVKQYVGAYYKKKGYRVRPVIQYSVDGKILKKWPSIKEAGKALKISTGQIVNVCKGRIRKTGGFKWSYES